MLLCIKNLVYANPNSQHTNKVLGICGAVAGIAGFQAMFSSNAAGNPDERKELVNIIKNPKTQSQKYR